MLKIILYQPEIPPNTGNIIRLCANTGTELHLIKPLGFELNDKRLLRAGLDYREWANIQTHENFKTFFTNVKFNRLFACSTKATQNYTTVAYQTNDAFIFGPESRGLPEEIRNLFPKDYLLKIPMRPQSRSLNLSNAVAIILYEAWRQLGFC